MINFAVGPVQMDEEIRAIGAEEVPYFRTPEFSAIMKENERLMKQFTGAPEDARAVFLTGSGTAAMEAAVMNLFTERDRVLVVNGGSFARGLRKFVRSMKFLMRRSSWRADGRFGQKTWHRMREKDLPDF